MTLNEMYAAIRAETGHDSDQQIENVTHLNPWLKLEYQKLRRKLSARLPSLFTATSSTTVLSGSTQTIPKPVDFERLVRLERLEGDTWVALPRSTQLLPHMDDYLGFREEAANLVVGPVTEAPGSYRLVYVTAPATCWPAGDIPAGFEDILISNVCARVEQRTGGDPAPYWKRAEQTWKEMYPLFKERMGNAPEPGFVQLRGD